VTSTDGFHPAILSDPESLWGRIREFLCGEQARAQPLIAVDLVEDLMFHHSRSFIDRIEALADECPNACAAIRDAYVGGREPDDAIDRFMRLQERLRSKSS
jgi:hypothetical protein